jgi:hypothetical protein
VSVAGAARPSGGRRPPRDASAISAPWAKLSCRWVLEKVGNQFRSLRQDLHVHRLNHLSVSAYAGTLSVSAATTRLRAAPLAACTPCG